MSEKHLKICSRDIFKTNNSGGIRVNMKIYFIGLKVISNACNSFLFVYPSVFLALSILLHFFPSLSLLNMTLALFSSYDPSWIFLWRSPVLIIYLS